MYLLQLVDLYCLERSLKPTSVEQLRYCVRSLNRWADREVDSGELCDELVNRWLLSLEQSGECDPETIRSKRGGILTLWRWEADRQREMGTPIAFPHRVRLVKVVQKMPECWSLGEAHRVLDEAKKLDGYLPRGVRRSALMVLVILLGWHTGLRLGDLIRVRRQDIDEHGNLTITQGKTGWPIKHRLPIEVRAAIMATYPPERERVIGDAISRGRLMTLFKKVCDAAGVKSGTKMVRRSAATALESQAPGSAMRFLGHKTPGLAYRHYIDPRKLDDDRPAPPKLTG